MRTPAPTDAEHGVRGVDLFVRGGAEQPSHLVALVDRGELRVEVARRLPPAEPPALHADSAAGALPSDKVVVAPLCGQPDSVIAGSILKRAVELMSTTAQPGPPELPDDVLNGAMVRRR